MPQKDTVGCVGYTCMLSYPIDVSHLSFNFFCLLLLLVSISVVADPDPQQGEHQDPDLTHDVRL
jgi:hypothetical protein